MHVPLKMAWMGLNLSELADIGKVSPVWLSGVAVVPWINPRIAPIIEINELARVSIDFFVNVIEFHNNAYGMNIM